jgi:sulfite reductase (ferredoxin)
LRTTWLSAYRFHGSSFKVGTNVVPALQVLLGGGTLGDGKGRIAEKVIKVASKRGPDVLRTLFNDLKKMLKQDSIFILTMTNKAKIISTSC